MPESTIRAAPSNMRRSKRSHQAVLSAAESLLAARGYSSITIDQIAAAAGVSKATIYRWWPNKASIFMELYTNLAAGLQPPVDTGHLAADLRALVRGAFKLFRETIAGVALAGFIAEAQSNPAVANRLRNEFAPQRRSLSKAIFKRAIARGEIPAHASIDIFSDLITGFVYHSILVGNAAMTTKRADEAVRAIVNGLRSTSEDTIPARGG
jgi:AcrR family transcriptional regulator